MDLEDQTNICVQVLLGTGIIYCLLAICQLIYEEILQYLQTRCHKRDKQSNPPYLPGFAKQIFTLMKSKTPMEEKTFQNNKSASSRNPASPDYLKINRNKSRKLLLFKKHSPMINQQLQDLLRNSLIPSIIWESKFLLSNQLQGHGRMIQVQ